METFKNFTKNTIEAFEIEPIFEKLSFLIRGNSNDIDKLKNEYVKEIQQKKQFQIKIGVFKFNKFM